MSLDNFSSEELKQKSMLEITSLILKDAKKALKFADLYDKVAEIKGFTKQEKEEQMAQFYTELNVDGRFMTLGSNVWGLREWYTVEQQGELITTDIEPTRKRRKSKKKADDDEDELDFDEDDEEFDLLDDDIEELDEDDDEEEVEEKELDEELDEDFDEDLDEEFIDEDEAEIDEELDFDDDDEEK